MPAWVKNPWNWLYIGVIAGVTWYMVKLVQVHYQQQQQVATAADASTATTSQLQQ